MHDMVYFFLSVYKNAGFLATLSSNYPAAELPIGTYDVNDVTKFDSIVYNDGGHYSTATGKWTAPLDGYYLITVQVLFKIVNVLSIL